MTAMTSAAVVGSAEQTDEAVIRQVLEGNTAMFELLMRRYNERVYRAARAIVRDEHEAEDVMQQAYVNAFTHLRQFNGSSRFSTWLTRIAINESLARVRRRGRYETFDELSNVEPFMSSNVTENPERQAFTGELRGLLEWAIDTLPDGMREVFVLREVEGLRHVRSGGVPGRIRGCRQDAPITRPRGVTARAARAHRRDRAGSLSVLSSSLRSSRRAGACAHYRTMCVTSRRALLNVTRHEHALP